MLNKVVQQSVRRELAAAGRQDAIWIVKSATRTDSVIDGSNRKASIAGPSGILPIIQCVVENLPSKYVLPEV